MKSDADLQIRFDYTDARPGQWRGQEGAVLVIGLTLLAMMTVLALGAMRVSVLEERMAGNLSEETAAFQASEAAMQAALTAIEASGRPIAADAWGANTLVTACRVTDSNAASGCTKLEYVLADWRSTAVPTEGITIQHFGGSSLGDVAEQPRVAVEERFVPADLEFQKQVTGAGYHYYTVTSFGTGLSGRAERIMQTTIAKVYAW